MITVFPADAVGDIDGLQRAVVLNPDRADAWNELGIALHVAGRLAEAEAAYRRALSLQPDFPRAECNLAVLQRDSGRVDFAESTLRAVISRQPMAAAFRPALNALADLLRARGELDEAAALYLRAAKQAPDDSAGEMLDLGMVLAERDDPEQARKAFGHALRQDPHQLRAALAMHLTLPVIYTDASHVARARAEYARGLEMLERELPSRIAGKGAMQVADGLIWSNFYLAYQGEPDRDLQARYAALAARALDGAGVQWRAPMAAGAVVGRKIRIGFVSALLREHTVGRYFMRWITDLDRDRFEVWFYALTASVDAVTEAITARADHVRMFVGGEAAPSAIAPLIRSDLLDILVYPELGMDQVTFALGALRLAPRQYAAWGHPVTTGHATIDAFLSCEAMEPEDAQAQYTEPLALLPGIGTRFAPAELPARRGREVYSLPLDATLLLCPQSLFKIHPDNDLLFARILGRESAGDTGIVRRPPSGDHRPVHAPVGAFAGAPCHRHSATRAGAAADAARGLSGGQSRMRCNARHAALVRRADQRRRAALRVANRHASRHVDARTPERCHAEAARPAASGRNGCR